MREAKNGPDIYSLLRLLCYLGSGSTNTATKVSIAAKTTASADSQPVTPADSEGTDTIYLPEPATFKDGDSYTSIKAHELVHWTGHDSRLARQFGKRFGDQAYAFEELVAELGAAFLCAVLKVNQEPREDHASYLASWLAVLKEDKRAIFLAATHAQRAVDFLCGQTEQV